MIRIDHFDQQMNVHAETVIRVLGSSSLPRLDILLRETVQNSLDAADGADGEYVTFEFDLIKSRNHDELIEKISFLEKQKRGDVVYKRLTQRIREGDPVLIVLSDKGTTGLSGPVRQDDKKWHTKEIRKNFDSLVYQLGNNHQTAGAGGSYGFGKSILYQLSPAHLVMYYTRCKEGERLAFCMISKEEKMATPGASGIFWWGEKYKPFKTDFAAPIEKAGEIRAILKQMGLADKRLQAGETGTVICIVAPLLKDLLNGDGVTGSQEDVLKNMVTTAIQQWYWPRMIQTDEVRPGGRLKPLKFFNCDQEITPAPQYKALGQLLRAAENMNNGVLPDNPHLRVEKIDHSYGHAFLGTLAFQILDINENPEHLNRIFMIRWPRMVVFDIPISERGDKAVAAVFLANSKAMVWPNNQRNAADLQWLDNAFKDCESATHSEWNWQKLSDDKSWFKLYVKRVRDRCPTIIQNALHPVAPVSNEAVMSSSAKVLGQLLVSMDGGGVQTYKGNGGKGGGSGGGGGGGQAKPNLRVGAPEYLPNGDLQFELVPGNVSAGTYRIAVLAGGNGQSMDSHAWKRKLGNEFPFRIAACDGGSPASLRITDEAYLEFTPGGGGAVAESRIQLTIQPVRKDALIAFGISKIND